MYYNQDEAYQDRREEDSTELASKMAQVKKKIYIYPFFNETPFGGNGPGQFVSEELTRMLRESNKIVVPEFLRSGAVSKDFFVGDKVRLSALVKEGKKLGLNLVVVGRVKRIIFRQKDDDIGLLRRKRNVAAVDLEMRMFDVIEQKEVFLSEKTTDSIRSSFHLFQTESDDPRAERTELVQESLRKGAQMFHDNILRALSKMAWEGRIAKIGVGKIFITAGRESGIHLGDILRVTTSGEDIYDPLTGDYMGRSKGVSKGTLEVVDYIGTDGAVATIHSGGGFSENDIVQLY
ncbi:MAG: hypothetical protein AB7F43_13340 [Bacteriovoracia bacterium]